MKGAVWAAVVVLGLVYLASACDYGVNVTYRNETQATITIWIGQSKLTDLPSGEQKTYSDERFPGTRTYRATDPQGNVLFERTFTFEELRDYGDIIVTQGTATPGRR